jgi:GR25 family glycosyltransferase involved in LPS biosynthesis
LKAFVITLFGNEYSERKAMRCVDSFESVGEIQVSRVCATHAESAEWLMKRRGLRWTWAKGNTADDVCQYSGLKQRPYGRLAPKIGCAMSHYLLWEQCVHSGEPYTILEHDAICVRRFDPFEFRSICQINDPKGATPKGEWWSAVMKKRGPGVFDKTKVFPDDVPDGLAGNSAYVIKPEAAQALIDKVHEVGLWPNDALMCRQFFDLQELYPFVTRVEQEVSTSS